MVHLRVFSTVMVVTFLVFPIVSAKETTIIMPHNPDSEVVIDGTIGEGEYENSFTNPGIEITVHWEHDNTYMYIGLTSPGVGWVSIGFNRLWLSSMGGANMILAAVENDGSFRIYDLVSKEPYMHENASTFNVIDAAGTRDNKVVVEFKYPLKFSENDAYEISELKPGEAYEYLLAAHDTSTDISKQHTRVSSGQFFIGDNLPPGEEYPSPPGEPSALSWVVLASIAVLGILGAYMIWRKIMS